jgi:hypothetical protein
MWIYWRWGEERGGRGGPVAVGSVWRCGWIEKLEVIELNKGKKGEEYEIAREM